MSEPSEAVPLQKEITFLVLLVVWFVILGPLIMLSPLNGTGFIITSLGLIVAVYDHESRGGFTAAVVLGGLGLAAAIGDLCVGFDDGRGLLSPPLWLTLLSLAGVLFVKGRHGLILAAVLGFPGLALALCAIHHSLLNV